MIEILKHGKKKYYFVCEKCGCEFCSNGDEISSTKTIPVIRYILCPECENKINIENLDEHFYKKADDNVIDISPLPTELIDKYFNISYGPKYNKCERLRLSNHILRVCIEYVLEKYADGLLYVERENCIKFC